MKKTELASEVVSRLRKKYPSAECALRYEGDPFRLLVMGRLSAQCTDARVNIVCPALFAAYPDAYAMAEADPADVGRYIFSCGLYNSKAKDLVGMSERIVSVFGGRVPDTMEELVRLPGVGRKTANLILGDLYRVPGSVVVDTHCIRISNRLGLVDNLKEPEKIEAALRKILPPESSSDFCHCIVFHGRAVCDARSPKCEQCCVKDLCQAYEQGTVTQRTRKA